MDGDDAILLTPDQTNQSGSAFLTAPLSFAADFSFQASYSVRLSGGATTDCCGDPAGADGIAFVIHDDPDGEAALGYLGGGFGFAGNDVAPPNTTVGIAPLLAIEMDTWHNGTYDVGNVNTNGDHVAIDIGTEDNDYQTSIEQTGANPVGDALNDGEVKYF